MPDELKWYSFDKDKGSRQKRPPVKKYVLVRCHSVHPGLAGPIVVGYMKNAAGDKQCPYFVTPGARTGDPFEWCDCLPDNFVWREGTNG